MAARFPWLPNSNFVQSLSRTLVNRVHPTVRNDYPLPALGGPLPPAQPHTLTLHGKTVCDDPFHYMEDLFDRSTLNYVKAETKHTESFASKIDLKFHRGRLWAELDAKVLVTTREGGYDKGEERIGDYIYFTRTVSGSDSEVGFYRKKVGEADLLGQELINPTLLRQQFGYSQCSIGLCRVSSNGELLAYTIAVDGSDRYICHVRSVENASLFHIIRGNNIVSIEFGSSNQFFFTEANELNRPNRVLMQEIRPGLLPPAVEVYRDDDEQYFVDVRKTKDGQYMMLISDSKLKSNVSVLPALYPVIPHEMKPFFEPGGRPLPVSGKRDSWSWLDHYKGYFLRVRGTDASAYEVSFCRVEVVLVENDQAEWKTLFTCPEGVQIVDVDLFDGRIVVYEAHQQNFERINYVRVINVAKGLEEASRSPREDDVVLHFPPLSSLTPGLNRNFGQTEFSFMHSSLIQPVKECKLSFSTTLTAAQCLVAAPHALYTQRQSDQFTPWDYMWPYSIYRDVCTGHDGEQIPITVVQRSDSFVQEMTDFEPEPNTPKPCLICVYGSYGEVSQMHFQVAPFMWLLRRRWTVAFAHVRGGGERPGWAEKGRGKHKINTTLDFISCCEHMVAMGYTLPKLMVALGTSAGCVPIGAAMNMRGDSLFSIAIMRAPFLDVLNTMVDPELPLSLVEREDWGDPLNNSEDLDRLLQYDPYHNINDRVNYPAMMISACLDDDRVPGWNALKYVAKLRHQRTRKGVDPIKTPLVLRVQRDGGHYKWGANEEICDELTFLSNLLDLEGPGKVLNDMDMMTHMNNLTSTGAMDHQEAEQVFLKWDTWERERIDFHKKLMGQEYEPNYRKLKAEKQPFFWVPTQQEVSQKYADELLNEKLKSDEHKMKGTSTNTGSIGTPVGKNQYHATAQRGSNKFSQR